MTQPHKTKAKEPITPVEKGLIVYVVVSLLAWPFMTFAQAFIGTMVLFLFIFLSWPLLGWFIWLPMVALISSCRPVQKTSSRNPTQSGARQ